MSQNLLGDKTRHCCVYKCHNQEGFDSSVSFYTFLSRPYERERRQRKILAVRRAGWQKRPRDQTKSPSEGKVKDTPSSAGGSHQLQLCHDLTDESSISLELDESTDDQQGELLCATVEEECQHKDAATSCSTISAEKFPSLLHRAVGPSARVCFLGGFDTASLTPGAVKDLCSVCDNVFALLLSLLPEVRDKTTDVSLPNKLLIFLFKMKHGLPFSAIAVLFAIHETTA